MTCPNTLTKSVTDRQFRGDASDLHHWLLMAPTMIDGGPGL